MRAVLKKIYYKCMFHLRSIFIPRAYNWEISFVENIRGNTYSDVLYRQSRLRSITHQLDKTLTFKKVKKMDSLVDRIKKLLSDVQTSPEHEPELIAWCNNVLAEYDRHMAGNIGKEEGSSFDRQVYESLRDIIETRRSIRSFKSDMISREVLDQILSAGLWAPSGCNRQTIEYLVLEDKEDIKYCQSIAGEGYPFPQEASVAVVILVDPRNYALPGQRHMAYLEGGAAIQNILLTAHALDVGSCWLFWSGAHAKHDDFVRKFNLNTWLLPVSMVCLGYSNVKPAYCPVRKVLRNAVHRSP